jgi:urea carboxylase
VETNPGVRSCVIEYDQKTLPLAALMAAIDAADASLPDVTQLVLPSRIVHLPMAYEERWSRDAIERYMKGVRPEGPYLPSNVDYIAANNGLAGACGGGLKPA